MTKPNNRTPGFNVYLGTPSEKEQALGNLTEIAKALGFESGGKMIRWLSAQDAASVAAALTPLRRIEIERQLKNLSPDQ